MPRFALERGGVLKPTCADFRCVIVGRRERAVSSVRQRRRAGTVRTADKTHFKLESHTRLLSRLS